MKLNCGAVTLTIIGVFICGALPPLGIMFIIAAICMQRSFNGHLRYEHQMALEKQDEKNTRELILACRALP